MLFVSINTECKTNEEVFHSVFNHVVCASLSFFLQIKILLLAYTGWPFIWIHHGDVKVLFVARCMHINGPPCTLLNAYAKNVLRHTHWTLKYIFLYLGWTPFAFRTTSFLHKLTKCWDPSSEIDQY